MPIHALSPTRVDLAGGTLDITPLTQLLKHKMTVNFGITLHAAVEISRSLDGDFHLLSHDQGREVRGDWSSLISSGHLPLLEKILQHFWLHELPPLSIAIRAKSPAGAGLGGSSCLGIALASALLQARSECGQPWDLGEAALVQHVQDLETAVIRVPTGCQDYWGGLRGGINLISYPPGGVAVETLRDADVTELRELLMLCYSGVSRASGTNNWAIFKKAFEGDAATLGILNDIGQLSEELALAIKGRNWTEVFRLSAAEWSLRTRLWSDIETPETRSIAAAAVKAGAQFTRICGAGGGGVMAIFAAKDRQEKVQRAIEQVGGRILDGQVSIAGTVVSGSLG